MTNDIPQKPTEEARQTDYLNLPKGEQGLVDRVSGEGTAMLSPKWTIKWRIGDQTLTIGVPEKLIIGRALEGEENFGLDLTPYGAYHFGVSRHHAALFLIEGYLYLEDNNSTNGTRINGFELTPAQKYRLRDGDEIEFARLRTVIRFEQPRR